MKKTFFLGAVAAAAFTAASPAIADGHSGAGIDALNLDTLKEGAYAAGFVGTTDLGLDDAITVTGLLGTDLGVILPNLSAEVETTFTAADAEAMGVEASYFAMGAYASYSYNLGERVGVQGLDVFGRAGLGYSSVDVDAGMFSGEADDTGLVFGVGVNYNLQAYTGTEDFGLRAEYVDDGADTYRVGVSYVF